MEVRLTHNENLQLSKKAIRKVIVKLQNEKFTELNNALIQLLEDSYREISNMALRMKDLILCSLHLRSIFELNLILHHVHSDDKALKNWYGQAHKDSKDIRDGFIELLKRKNLDTSMLEDIQEFEDKSLKNSPYQSKGGFQIKNLAEKYGYLEDYLFVYKLSSKLLHPTSMKVSGYNVLTENENYLNLILYSGVYFSRKIEDFALSLNAKIA